MKYIKFANGKPLEVSDQNYKAVRRAVDTMLRLRCEIWQEQRRIERICKAELSGFDQALAEIQTIDDCLAPGTDGDSELEDFLLDVRLMKVNSPAAGKQERPQRLDWSKD